MVSVWAKRAEISTPIIAILVTVAALAVTGIAVAWMVKVGTSAAKQGVLSITGTAILTYDPNDGSYHLTFTIRNIGNQPAKLLAVQIASSPPIKLNSTNTSVDGESSLIIPTDSSSHIVHIVVPETSIPTPSSEVVQVILHTDQGSITFSAYYG
ncbi:MAG TPA: hypothetical protein EYH40_05265 [Desulfurococcales archaeon]|nr:hypothetical protein [Desulfurococcales archaeon]